MNAKTTYTMKELTKRSTTQLIAIYNRVFNTNVWDEMFNPYEARQEMILALYAETQAAEALARLNAREAAGQALPRYSGVKVQYMQDGVAIMWESKFTNPVASDSRKFDDATIAQVRQLRAGGESVDTIAKAFGMPKNRVYRICRGNVYAESLV